MDAELVFKDLLGILQPLGLRFAVGGSYASGAQGHPRQTNDIDIVLELSGERVSDFGKAVAEKFNVTDSDMDDAASGKDPHRSFQLFHFEALFKVDVFLGVHPRLIASELERAETIQLLPGIWAPCLTAEDIVIEKLLWYQMGNRVSDRQWNDVVGVIEVQGPNFDRAYVRKWAAELGVLDLAEEAYAEAKDF